MELLSEAKLLRKQGDEFVEVAADKGLENVKLVGFYFTAEWCTSSVVLTPLVAESYQALKAANEPFEIIYVSSDESEEDMKDTMMDSHGDWLAVRFDDSQLISNLEEKFKVDGYPTLIFVCVDTSKVVGEVRPRENLNRRFMRALNISDDS